MAASVDRPATQDFAWPLDPYLIIRLIGSGKFGTVYYAKHVPTAREVALKLIPTQGTDGTEKVAAERHGAMLQERFGQIHKGLVPEVYDHQQLANFYAIAMELVQGQPLTDVIAKGPLSPRRAAAIALAICRFLEQAHRFETDIESVHYALIVHGDLKPDHVLLLDDDRIRVLDFGIAKALAARTLVTTNKWGSIQYASPERLQSDGHVNEQADFWSLGVMLFEMVSGFRPYQQYEANPGRLDAAIRRQEMPAPLPPAADPVLVAIIHKLLAPQIERRYTSADSIAADLEAFLSGAPTVAAIEQAQAGQQTVRIVNDAEAPPQVPVSIATDPLPAGARDAQSIPPIPPIPVIPPPLPPLGSPVPPKISTTVASPMGPKAGTTRSKEVRRPSFRRRLLKLAFLGIMIAMATAECAAMARAERLLDQIPALEPADIPAVRAAFRDIDGMSPFNFAVDRVGDPLKNRMIDLAERTILEYRTEAPTVAQVQWEQARDCLALAWEIAPGDSRVRSKRAYTEGQLARITARDRGDIDRAVRSFREAARLDPDSPDPYLGLARIHASSTRDIDALSDAIDQAEARGYKAGRRERAQFADLYRLRGDRARAAAGRLSGSERETELDIAEEAYEKCIEYLDGLKFFNSETNLRLCRRRLVEVRGELHVPSIVPPWE